MTDTEQKRRENRAEFVTRLFVVALVLTVAVLVAVIFQIRSTQLDGTPLGKKLVASSDRILDCTSPTGDCYQRSQSRTQKAVGQIGLGNILAVVCALQVPNGTPLDAALDEVTECVANRLAQR